MINISNILKSLLKRQRGEMSRAEAIMKMKGADEDAYPILIKNESIFSWDIDLNLKEFSDEQIEEFYDAEVEDERI
jgi:hypothetical protein